MINYAATKALIEGFEESAKDTERAIARAKKLRAEEKARREEDN